MCPFDYTAVAGSGKVGPVNQVNHTSWIAVVTPTDRSKSVRNRCVIELFVVLFVLSRCPFDISAGVGAFVTGLSQISSFFYSYNFYEMHTELKFGMMIHTRGIQYVCPFAFKARSATLIFVEFITVHQTSLLDDVHKVLAVLTSHNLCFGMFYYTPHILKYTRSGLTLTLKLPA